MSASVPVRPSTAKFLLLTLAFHVLYISSVFDIYFTSPVVHPIPRFSVADTYPGTQHPKSAFEPLADRLVLIVGDGLRADTLFKAHQPHLIPSWARADLSSRSEDQLNWPAFEQSPFQSEYPYISALDQQRKPSNAPPEATTPNPAFAAPFLRSVALHRGAWGLSHTRVPTESRPGHVAMIAGMYEDVSAVTKGWKLNPIAFDSVLNQSSHSFAFGSPDIVPMFAVGAASQRVDMWTYDEAAEDFTKDATGLDIWVLDRLRELFEKAKTDAHLASTMRKKRAVFFLHLLGLDTTGHTHRPFSQEYVGNTIVVDAIAREVEKLFDDFYQHDGRTAYVFTADHGMSTKGNHGDGDPDNTRTPLVAWGAGVRKPIAASSDEQDVRSDEADRDRYYQDWHLDRVSRVDIDQADITPLMASLIDVPVPANSEGRLRTHLLDTPIEHRARALMANALQVLETYRVKHDSRASRMIRFVPFKPLVGAHSASESSNSSVLPGSAQLTEIRSLIEQGDWPAVIEASEQLIQLALEGARYLQTYDWLLLCSIVTIGYLGSILYGLAFLLRAYVVPEARLKALPQPSVLSGWGKALVAPILGITFAKFAREESPVTYYLYTGSAAFLWGRVIDERRVLAEGIRNLLEPSTGDRHRMSITGLALRCLLGLAALELMVVGYLHRVAWLVGFLVVGLLWPAFGLNAHFKSQNEALLLAWGMSCICSGLFAIGDLDKEESIPLLCLSGALFFAAGLVIVRRPDWFFPSAGADAHREHTLRTIKVQMGVLVVTTIVTASSARSLQLKQGLPLVNQVVAWAAMLFAFVFPFAYGFRRPRADGVRQSRNERLAIVVFGFAPIFVLLSLRDEALFFGCYTLHLLAWGKLEGAIYETRLVEPSRAVASGSGSGSGRALELGDVRISLFFLLFLHVGFFGTGNVASISSFYLSPVYRLVPIFSPFLMATLLVVKILVPFVILNSVLQALCATPPWPAPASRAAAAAAGGLRLVGASAPGGLGLRGGLLGPVFGACILTDLLALHFLYTVKSEGSWLEIGQTITHFVMANLLQIFMLSLAAFSSAVMGDRLGAED